MFNFLMHALRLGQAAQKYCIGRATSAGSARQYVKRLFYTKKIRLPLKVENAFISCCQECLLQNNLVVLNDGLEIFLKNVRR